MITNEYTLNLDIKKSISNVLPIFAKNETGILRFRIFDQGNLYDLSDYISSKINFRLPNGSSFMGNCNLEDGFIVYNLMGMENSMIGTINAVLTVNSNSSNISTQPFKIEVFDNLSKEEMNSITILQSLIAEVSLLNLEASQNLEGINSHVENQEIHVDQTQKNTWNNKANVFEFIVDIESSRWSNIAPFSQIVTVNEILETDKPIIGPVLSEDIEEAMEQQQAYDNISVARTKNGEIEFICFDNKPISNISIQLLVVR